MPVTCSMPGWSNRWLLFPSGVLGTDNTFRFHGPLGKPRSERLFLLIILLSVWLIASNEPLPDLEAGIAVGMSPHLAGWTDNERRAHLVAFLWLPLCIA